MGASCSTYSKSPEEIHVLTLLRQTVSSNLSLTPQDIYFLTVQYRWSEKNFMNWLDLIKTILSKTNNFTHNRLENIILALRHDQVSLDWNKINTWLTLSHESIIIACAKIKKEASKTLSEQSNNLKLMHHTLTHGIEVSRRSDYLCQYLSLSSTNSCRDIAYRSLRNLIFTLHDLIQTQKADSTFSNEVLTQNEVLSLLINELKLSDEKDPLIYALLEVMTHRFIVLGTTPLFHEQLFSLSEIYIESRKSLKLTSPFEALNKEMLIVGLSDRSPAYCLELIRRLKVKTTMTHDIWQTLGFNNASLLTNFFNQSTARKPYQNYEKDFISLLTALSPHIAISIEKSILNSQEEIEKHYRYYTADNHQEIKALNTQSKQAITLREYLFELKNNVWESSGTKNANMFFYSEIIFTQQRIISQKLQNVLFAFEDIVMSNLKTQAFYSKALMRHLSFLKDELGQALTIQPDAALAEAQNLLKLIAFYKNLPNDIEKIQLMHEIFLPFVIQEGQYPETQLVTTQKKTPISSLFTPLETGTPALSSAVEREKSEAFNTPGFF